MDNDILQFMVDFTLPSIITERFSSRIPEQRALVNQYFEEGKLVTYGVSLETGRCWAVFNAETETEADDLARELPLTKYMSYKVSVLTFMNVLTARVPSFSVN